MILIMEEDNHVKEPFETGKTWKQIEKEDKRLIWRSK